MNNYENAIERAITFDKYIEKTSFTDKFLKEHTERNTSLANIVNIYNVSEYYNDKHVCEIVELLIDIRIQQYYLEDFLPSMTARIIEQEPLDIDRDPKQFLAFTALNQSLIIQSRILFEKMMNFIHYFIYGKYEKSSNKKKNFFKLLENDEKANHWKFMLSWKPLIYLYDKKFRNPEIHDSNNINKFINHEYNESNIFILSNQILTLQNNINNTFWIYLVRILNLEKIGDNEIEILSKNIENACRFMEL